MAKASGSTRAKTSRTSSSSGGGSKYLQGKTFSGGFSMERLQHQDDMTQALHAYGQSRGYVSVSNFITKDLNKSGYNGNVLGYSIEVSSENTANGGAKLAYTSRITGHKSAISGSVKNTTRSFTTIEAAERYIKKKVKELNKIK